VCIAFVVFGFLAIILGTAMSWRWVLNVYFRTEHLAAILLVCVEALGRLSCPLTILENSCECAARMRRLGSFVGYLLDRLIYYDFPQRFFTVVYLSFGALVLLTFVLTPLRMGWSRKPP
jgi:hypothetical protein